MAELNPNFMLDAFRGRRLLDAGRELLIYFAAAFVGVVAGVISSDGRLSLIAIFAGLIMAGAVALSRKALVWFVIIGGLVVVGAAQLYLPGSKYVRYIIPLASLVLVLHGVMDRLSRRRRDVPVKLPAMLWWAMGFVLVAMVSAVVNLSELGVVTMGLKGYFQMWALLLAMVLLRWSDELLDSIPKGMLVIAFLQLPFVLHQYFVLVPKRVGLGSGIVPVDIVAGTFGATLYGGGANAVLAAFLLVVIACLVSCWKHGALTTTKVVLLCVPLMLPIFVNEAKISALYVPLIYIILFYRDIFVRPVKFILAGLAMLGALAVLLTALTLAQPSGKLKTWSDLVDFTFERQTASMSGRAGQFSELSRWTALTFWVDEHVNANPANVLLGHGPGASRVQDGGFDLASTLAEQRYGNLQIGYTALSAILWEVGVLGLIAVLGMFAAAFRNAQWLANYYLERDNRKAALFDGLAAAIALLALSLAHKDFFVTHLPYQTIIVLIMGYLAVARMRISEPDPSG